MERNLERPKYSRKWKARAVTTWCRCLWKTRDQGNDWAGVQCKGKDNYSNKSLTQKEVKDEVKKALSFRPNLSQFVIATTGVRDAKIQEFARIITDNHRKKNLFSVTIWFWDDIKKRLENFPGVLEKYYPGFTSNTIGIKKDINEIKAATHETLKNSAEILKINPSISLLSEKIENIKQLYTPDTSIILTSEHQAEIDYSRKLLKNYKPKDALEYLENLKDRIWSNTQPIVRYRLLTNIGSAKLSLGQEQDAARLFIEALQYNPEDEKALCNKALGHLLLGQLENAKTFANKVLAKNPANDLAYSILIQTFPDSKSLEDIITGVPEPYRKSPEIAYAISHFARKKKELHETKKWLEVAISNDKENIPYLKGDLGTVMLELITKDQSVFYSNQIDDSKKDSLKKTIHLLTEAWECIANTDIRNFRSSWIANRGIAKELLGDLEGAIKDVEIALEIEPSNPVSIKHKAILLYKSNNNQKAKELLKRIIFSKETPEASLLLAEILQEENNENSLKEAIRLIEEFLDNNSQISLQEDANRLLIELYIASKDFEKAKNISDFMRTLDPTNILNLVDAARISKFHGKNEDAISLLKEAKGYIDDSSSFRQLLTVANELYSLDEFENAVDVYEKIANTNLDSLLTRRLLICYYRCGKTGQALQICQSLRKKYGPLKYVSEMEAAIYEEIGDLNEAKNVCQEYLNLFPNDFDMRLRQAIINLHANNLNELDNFLNSSIDINTLSLEASLQIAHLYAVRELDQKSFRVMYEIRRKYFNNGDVHLKYINFILQREKSVDQFLNINNVCIDTAVCIKDSSGKYEWYIIEDRNDADISRGEISLKHPLAQKMLDKSAGDEFLFKENQFSKEIAKIKEIKSKFVYALHESLRLFEKLFPDISGFWGIKVGKPQKTGDLPEGFQLILDEINRKYETSLKIKQAYKEGKLTVGAFAKLVGRNTVDVWYGMVSDPDLGLKCCHGNIEERNIAISLLDNKSKLIVDITSLMTLHCINIADIVSSTYGKLGISQSTIDLIKDTIDERKGFESNGLMTVGKEGDKFIKHQISAEDIRRNIQDLEAILAWIDNNCDIIPCKAALNIKRSRIQTFNEMFGKSFIDTILISSESGNLLYSDDERLRSFAKSEFKAYGVWTQILLMHSLNNNLIERSKYNEIIIKLVNLNYYHTSIDKDILIEAAKQSNWSPSYPYMAVLKILSGKYSDENSALNVGTNFLYELWKQPILSHQRDYLTLSLLDTIVAERNRHSILDKLIHNIKNRFCILPLAEKQIISLIKIWKQMHVL